MIEFTGIINGEMVEEKVVSAADLIKEFSLPVDPGKESRIRFALHPSQVTVNRADGKERFGESRAFKPFILGSWKGNNYTIRYYQTKIKQGGNKSPRYTPNRIYFFGRGHSLRTPDHLEEIVMLMLHPSCGDSPFKKRNGRIQYRIADPVGDARKQLQSERILDEIRDQVLKASDEYVKQIALGVNLVHKRISKEHADNPIMARVAILELAAKDLSFVVKCLESVQIKTAGIAAKAIEKEQIRLASTGAGRRAWYYSETYGGTEICKVTPNTDSRQALLSHLSMPDERDRFLKGLKLQGADDLEGMGKPVGVEIDENDPSSLIDGAHKMGLINLHPGELKVYEVRDGQFHGRSFFQAESIENWKTQMKANTNQLMINRLKKLVRNAK